jgi:hypothetical protein
MSFVWVSGFSVQLERIITLHWLARRPRILKLLVRLALKSGSTQPSALVLHPAYAYLTKDYSFCFQFQFVSFLSFLLSHVVLRGQLIVCTPCSI